MLGLVGIIIGIAVVLGVGATAVFIGGCLAVRWVMDNFLGSGPRGGPRGQGPAQGSRHRAGPNEYAGSQRRNW
jgi:hypothetical protein